jgi:hypothetical protein
MPKIKETKILLVIQVNSKFHPEASEPNHKSQIPLRNIGAKPQTPN